ncbi:MAG TPA: GNAT family N-acetyltransferase [Methanoregulaceae archaeon]|nr:GNAT family N-acetyltransferase [Methanoregulaceae archaeon]
MPGYSVAEGLQGVFRPEKGVYGEMTFPDLFKRRDGVWNAAILGTSAAVLAINLAGLLMGITMVLPHLLYIPVVIAAYRYPQRGLLFAGCIAGFYFVLVLLFAGAVPGTILEALVRAVVVVIIGGLIAFLSRRLREKESLYRGLFDNSESGSLLIREGEGGRIVEDANEKAATLIERTQEELEGEALSLFWSKEEENAIFSRLSDGGRVAAAETVFSTAEGGTLTVLVSLAPLPDNRAILSFENITRRVNAERALQNANDKLSLLSRIANDHLHRTVNEIIEAADSEAVAEHDEKTSGFIDKVRTLAWNLARQLFLTETYQDLGASPPDWMPVHRILQGMAGSVETDGVSRRFWIERLEIYADPLFKDVLAHLVENSLRHGKNLGNIFVTYQQVDEGLDLFIEDDGEGIPVGKKEQIFEYDSGKHSGLGLFICRQIISVTGMTIREDGKEGEGARFVIHVPENNYRIEGASEDAPPFPAPADPEQVMKHGTPHKSGTVVKELTSTEFPIANELWIDYHETKGDPATDRIFAAFAHGEAVSLARCRWHPDGLEVDGVFTPERHRGHGYANAAVWGLIEACGHDTLYMHSVLNLTGFYGHYGFVPIDEDELPPMIRERFAWAQGAMEGANVCPMRREATE